MQKITFSLQCPNLPLLGLGDKQQLVGADIPDNPGQPPAAMSRATLLEICIIQAPSLQGSTSNMRVVIAIWNLEIPNSLWPVASCFSARESTAGLTIQKGLQHGPFTSPNPSGPLPALSIWTFQPALEPSARCTFPSCAQ